MDDSASCKRSHVVLCLRFRSVTAGPWQKVGIFRTITPLAGAAKETQSSELRGNAPLSQVGLNETTLSCHQERPTLKSRRGICGAAANSPTLVVQVDPESNEFTSKFAVAGIQICNRKLEYWVLFRLGSTSECYAGVRLQVRVGQ